MIEVRYIRGQSRCEVEGRAGSVVAILATGVERLLKGQGLGAGSGVDLPPAVSVTTDCQSSGHVEEN